MLRPYTVAAPSAGYVRYRLHDGDFVNPGTLVARIDDREVRSPAPGSVRRLLAPDGASVTSGQPLVEIAPDETHAREALRALYLVGTEEDADDVAPYARGSLGEQAAYTLRQINARARRNP
jgi:multidrug efflux pump subunit AcrA (membrane-fusion protein)